MDRKGQEGRATGSKRCKWRDVLPIWQSLSPPRTEGHDLDVFSVSVIGLQALQAALHVGISVPGDVFKDGRQYLKLTLAKSVDEKTRQNPARKLEMAGFLASIETLINHNSKDEERDR